MCLISLIVKTCLSQDNTAIDFSGGQVDLVTGAVCVEREEEREVVEQDTEQQCTQQIVRKGELKRRLNPLTLFGLCYIKDNKVHVRQAICCQVFKTIHD